jgi:hypothetical protein
VHAQKDSVLIDLLTRNPIENRNHTVSNQVQVITAEQIRKTGYTRLSDVLQLADAYIFATATGTSWMLNHGSQSLLHQNLILMVDGQRVDFQALDGTMAINQMGLSVADIQRIEIVSAAGNYMGEFNARGIIHIITKELTQNGWIYSGFASQGITSFIDLPTTPANRPYTQNFDYNSTNRIGFNHAHRIAYKKDKWQFSAGYVSQIDNLTSGIMQVSTAHPYRYRSADSFAIQPSFHSGRLSVAYHTDKTYSQSDLTFYSGLTSNHVYLSSHVRSLDSTLEQVTVLPYWRTYRYGANLSNFTRIRKDNGYIQLRTSVTMDGFMRDELSLNSFTGNNLALNTNWSFLDNGKGKNVFQYGIEKQVFVPIGYQATQDFYIYLAPYISGTQQLNKRSFISADLYSGFDGYDFLPKASLTYYKAPTILNNYSLVLSYAKRNIYHDDRMRTLSIYRSSFPSETLQQTAALEGYYNLNIGRHFKVSVMSALRYTENDFGLQHSQSPWFIMPRTDLDFIFAFQQNNLTGLNWINRFNLHYDVLKSTMLDFNYLNIRSVNANGPLVGIPRNRFSTQLTFDVTKLASFWIRHMYQTSTKWYAQREVTDANSFIQNPFETVASMHTFHIAWVQQLWKKRLHASINYRNAITNGVWGREQYLPIDNHMNFRLFASLQLYLQPPVGKATAKP